MREFLKNNKNYIKETIIIIIVGIIINVACFLMPLVVHAASDQQYFPFPQNYYSVPYDDITSYLASNNNTFSQAYNYYDYHFCTIQTNISGRYTGFYIFSTSPCIATPNLDTGYFSLSLPSNQEFTAFEIQVSDTYSWFNCWERSDFNGRSWPSSFKENYSSSISNYEITNYDGSIIVLEGPPISMDPTEFSPSPLVPSPSDITKPTGPTITTPTIDTSLTLIENIKNLFHWLGETFKSIFKWAIDSIATFFDNLKNFLKDIINAVISAINNGFSNIFNNIKSLFYPFITFFTAYAQGIQDFIDAITDSQTGIIPFLKTAITNIRTNIASLVDDVIAIKNFLFGVKGFFDTYGVIWNQETWEEALDNSPWLDAVTENTSILSQFINGTLNVSEPQTLEFSFDFRNNRYCNFGLTTFNFDWYLPYKNSVRLAFLTICILNAVLYFFDEAPNWFSGGGSNKKGDK